MAAAAEAVRERLSRPLKESTVRTVLRRLEEKGYTTHTVDGRTYVYQAAEDRGKVAAKAVQRIVDWFCNGSVEEVLVGMVAAAVARLRVSEARVSPRQPVTGTKARVVSSRRRRRSRSAEPETNVTATDRAE